MENKKKKIISVLYFSIMSIDDISIVSFLHSWGSACLHETALFYLVHTFLALHYLMVTTQASAVTFSITVIL